MEYLLISLKAQLCAFDTYIDTLTKMRRSNASKYFPNSMKSRYVLHFWLLFIPFENFLFHTDFDSKIHYKTTFLVFVENIKLYKQTFPSRQFFHNFYQMNFLIYVDKDIIHMSTYQLILVMPSRPKYPFSVIFFK